MRSPFLLAVWLFAAVFPLRAQELRRQPIPFTAWLDFQALSRPNAPQIALPIWLESVKSEHPLRRHGEELSTVFRLRFRRMGELNPEIHLRLFFEDKPLSAPRITGWTETGELNYESGPLGAGMGMSNSADVLIPTKQLDYVEIGIPGDGSDIRGVFLSTTKKSEAKAAIDFAHDFEFLDPFGRMAEADNGPDDSYLFGRVRAALLAPATRLPPEEPIVLDFQLDRVPQLALVSFEVLNADVSLPPEVQINGVSLGAAAPRLPDLADPGFRGQAVSARADLQFRYGGWLHCEKIVPASAVRAGVNRLTLAVGRFTRPVALRSVQIQLKYPYEGVDSQGTP